MEDRRLEVPCLLVTLLVDFRENEVFRLHRNVSTQPGVPQLVTSACCQLQNPHCLVSFPGKRSDPKEPVNLLSFSFQNIFSKQHFQCKYCNLKFCHEKGSPVSATSRFKFCNFQIQDLEHILEDITENENKAQTLRNWLEAQSGRLRSLQTPTSLISAQNTLDDCKVKYYMCDIIVKKVIQHFAESKLKNCMDFNRKNVKEVAISQTNGTMQF